MAPEHQDIFRDPGPISQLPLEPGWMQLVSPHCLLHLYLFSFQQGPYLPLFLNSLHPDYARFCDKYNYLEFLFNMAEARYNVLASFLSSYLNRHSYTLFVAPSILFHARSLHEFMSTVRSLPNPTALKRKDLAYAVNFS